MTATDQEHVENLLRSEKLREADEWEAAGIRFDLPLGGRVAQKEVHRQWQRRVAPDILPDSPNADAAEKIPFRFLNSLTTARKTQRRLDDVLEGEFAPLAELFVRHTKGRSQFPIAFHVLPVKSTKKKIESRAFTERTILMLCRREDGSLDEELVTAFLQRFRKDVKELDLAQRLLLEHLEPDWDPSSDHTPEYAHETEGPPPFAIDACRLFRRDLRTLLSTDIPSGDFFEFVNSLLAIHLGLYQVRIAFRLNKAIQRIEEAVVDPNAVDTQRLEAEQEGRTADTNFSGRLAMFVPPTRGDRRISMTASPRLSYQDTEKQLGELHFSLMLFHRVRELSKSFLRSEMGIREPETLFEMTRWPSQIVYRLQNSDRYLRYMRRALEALVIRFTYDQLSEERRARALAQLRKGNNPFSALRHAYALYNLQPPAKPTKNRAYRQGIILLNSLLKRGEFGLIGTRPRVGGYFELGLGLLPLILLLVVGARGEKVQLDVFWSSLSEYGFRFSDEDKEELLSRLRSMGLYERFSDAGAANYVRSLLIVDGPVELPPPPEPPDFEQPAPKEVKQEPEVQMKECPHCGETKPVSSGFGYRTMDGEQRPQSWCRDCRAGRTDSEPSPGQAHVETLEPPNGPDDGVGKVRPDETVVQSSAGNQSRDRFKTRLVQTLSKLDLVELDRALKFGGAVDLTPSEVDALLGEYETNREILFMPDNYVAANGDRQSLFKRWKKRRRTIEALARKPLEVCSDEALLLMALFLDRESGSGASVERLLDELMSREDADEEIVDEAEELKFARSMGMQ